MLELLFISSFSCKTNGIGGEMKMSYTAKQARMNRAVALGFNCSSDNEYRVNKKMMSNQNQCDDDDDVRIN